ncbi:uncharacterized protein LOC102310778 isoform X4 [Haplochromis burtoni]|nr:uncharacterized protein LOC102310778 isoform X4 [Haplochromis burtoni]XP_014187094.1 uncharacterized protein LOC102310778 isoform X4 [Haplochromis burtoni]
MSVINKGDTTKGIITSTTTKTAISANAPKSKSATSTTEPEKPSKTVQTKHMLIILAGGFLVLFIILALIGWKRNKRNKTQKSDEIELRMNYCGIPQTSQKGANPAADVSYSSIKKTRNKTRVQSNDHKDVALTFSTFGKASNNDNRIYMNMKSIQKARGSYF